MEIDAEKTQIRIPIRLAAAIAATFMLWWVTTYVIPLSDEVIKLKEEQARAKAEYQSLADRIKSAERRTERLEDRINAK